MGKIIIVVVFTQYEKNWVNQVAPKQAWACSTIKWTKLEHII